MTLEPHDIGIVADDLTGACDVAACFVSRLGEVVVNITDDLDFGREQTLQVVNTQSRLKDCSSARSIFRRVGSLWGSKEVIFKKIDTGLRGSMGAELAGLLEGLSSSGKQWNCVVAPAAPSIGRTTRGGIQYEYGIPVHKGALSSDPDSPPPSADIRGVIRQTGGEDCLVADAESSEDLDRIVDEHLAKGCVVLVGSLGLATALACKLRTDPRKVKMGPAARRPVLVCGSRHRQSSCQVERAKREGIHILSFDPELLHFDAPVGRDWNGPFIIRILPGERLTKANPSETILSSFVGALCSLLERIQPDGLGIIGGETAFHVLRRMGAQRLEVFRREAQVIASSRIVGGVLNGCRFVSKGGSVGPEEAVCQMLSLLGE